MFSSKRLTLSQLAVLLMMVFSFVASAVISRNVLERLPHLEDEFGYFYQAKIFAGLHAWVERHEPIKYFWQPFIIQPETESDGVFKRFGKYPPGWPLVLTLGVWLGQPWLVNAFLGMLSVGLVYRLGREIFDEAVGVASALFCAISPMTLLLNATLMNHTWAMFAAIVFFYAYWRTTKHGKGRYLWAALGGLFIGGVIATRPLSAVAVAAPAALHASSRLWDSLSGKTAGFLATSRVLVIMAVFVLPTALLWPLFNHVWTGDWKTNTYTLLWSYDKVGFGPGYGLNPGGHSLAYGWRNARSDLRVWLRDVFGFTMLPQFADYAKDNFAYGAGEGLSWIPIIFGLFMGRKKEWVWVFFMVFVFTVTASLAYWIGSVVNGSAAYSLRYYYESTFAVCIVAGYGAVAWARSLRKARAVHQPASHDNQAQPDFNARLRLAWRQMYPGYFLLLVACGLSVFGYTPARFREPLPREWPNGLYRYNKIGQHQLQAIQDMRQQTEPSRPVLIVILNDPDRKVQDNWRDYGAAMAVTSPYLDSDIIVVRVFEPENVDSIVQRFPGRLVLYQIGENLYRSVDEALAKATAQRR